MIRSYVVRLVVRTRDIQPKYVPIYTAGAILRVDSIELCCGVRVTLPKS